MENKRTSYRQRLHFTLIELIIIIAIIITMGAVISPILTQVRQTAQATNCVANKKKCTLKMSLYADDNQAYMPLTDIIVPGKYQSWADILMRGGYLKPKDPSMLCPSVKPTQATFAPKTKSYQAIFGVINSYQPYIWSPFMAKSPEIEWGNAGYWLYIATQKVKTAQSYPVLLDSWNLSTQTPFNFVHFYCKNKTVNYLIQSRHGQRISVSYLDGSTRLETPLKLKGNLNKTRRDAGELIEANKPQETKKIKKPRKEKKGKPTSNGDIFPLIIYTKNLQVRHF